MQHMYATKTRTYAHKIFLLIFNDNTKNSYNTRKKKQRNCSFVRKNRLDTRHSKFIRRKSLMKATNRPPMEIIKSWMLRILRELSANACNGMLIQQKFYTHFSTPTASPTRRRTNDNSKINIAKEKKKIKMDSPFLINFRNNSIEILFSFVLRKRDETRRNVTKRKKERKNLA